MAPDPDVECKKLHGSTRINHALNVALDNGDTAVFRRLRAERTAVQRRIVDALDAAEESTRAKDIA